MICVRDKKTKKKLISRRSEKLNSKSYIAASKEDAARLQEFIANDNTLVSDDTTGIIVDDRVVGFVHARACYACMYVDRRLTDAAYLHCVAVQLSLVSGIKRRKFRTD